MAKTALEQWDETAANNTDRGGVNIGEGCNPSDVNNAMRELMSQVAKFIGDDTVASATTADLGAVPGRYVTITGTTTITGFGTIKAGTIKYVRFSGILTLTHNATSLILRNGANITTAAGDTAIFASEGSGNWRCLAFQTAASSIIPSTIGTAGQSLRVNSGATALEYQTGWETLAGSGAFTAQSNIDFTGLSAYTRLKISLWLTPTTDATTIGFRTRTGGSVDAGASDYNYFYIFAQEAGVPTRFGLTTGTIVPLNINNVGSAANESMHVQIEIEQFNKATYMSAFYTVREMSATPVAAYASGGFSRLNAAARDGFRIAVSSGTTITGTILVEGMRG